MNDPVKEINTFQNELRKELSTFLISAQSVFPMEETLIPIMKRKIMAYVFQIVNYEKINNFDSEE